MHLCRRIEAGRAEGIDVRQVIAKPFDLGLIDTKRIDGVIQVLLR